MLKTILTSLFLLSPRQRWAVGLLATATLASNALDILALSLLSLVGTTAVGGDVSDFFPWLSSLDPIDTLILLLSVIACLFVLKTVTGIALARVRQRYLAGLEVHYSGKIAKQLLSSEFDGLKGKSRADLEWAILRSSSIAFGSVLGQALQLFAEASLAILIVLVFFLTDWLSAIIVILYFGLVLALFQMVTRAKGSRTGAEFTSGSVGVSRSISDIVTAFREISVQGKMERFVVRMLAFRSQVAHAQAVNVFLQSIPRLVVELALIVGGIGFVAFQYGMSEGDPDLTVISIFIFGSLRMMSALLPLYRAYMQLRHEGALAQSGQDLVQKTIQAGQRVTLDVGPDSDARHYFPLLAGPPAVSVQEVTFKFADEISDIPTLNRVSFDVPGGAFAAIIGPSGAGKSTLVDLLLGLHRPTLGSIKIDDLSPMEFRSTAIGAIGYVPQKPGVVTGTIRENIALGVPQDSIDDQALDEAIKVAQLEKFIADTEGGLESSLGEHLDNLSGGQIQRIGLARALYHRPKLLVLDEATSALDPETESSIAASIDDLPYKPTIIVVAHRLSTVKNADIVFVLDNGAITASGTLRELEQTVPLVRKFISLMTID